MFGKPGRQVSVDWHRLKRQGLDLVSKTGGI